MDINLPGMSGFEATKKLREWPETSHIPVIALTAATMLGDRKRALLKTFGFGISPETGIDQRQIVQRGRNIGVLGSKSLFADRERSPVKRFRLAVHHNVDEPGEGDSHDALRDVLASHERSCHKRLHSELSRVGVERCEEAASRVARLEQLERFFSQPFYVAERFTCISGRYVQLKDTVRGFREILDGKCDDLPEQAFMMAGTIEDVREKAQKLAVDA
jgi:CheY-like chemotaxis protein